VATQAFADFAADVRQGNFPDDEHSYKMNPKEIEKLATALAKE
jgi:ketopantoate hydroxymethyltransferase